MLAEERRQKVREIIEEKGKITVEDIVGKTAERFGRIDGIVNPGRS